MVGSPKYLNTRFDYEYVKDNFDNWREYWQELYDSRMIWQAVEGPVTPDDTHRIIPSQDEDGNPTPIYQELTLDAHCKLLRLGFTESEVAAAIAA